MGKWATKCPNVQSNKQIAPNDFSQKYNLSWYTCIRRTRKGKKDQIMAWKNADVSFRFSNWPSIDAEAILSDILEKED